MALLLAALHWHGARRRAAARRMVRIGTARGHSRWERAARRWLACSAKIAALLDAPEPPQVMRLRASFEDPRSGDPAA
ncbi:hypothetical protein ABC766_32105 (plasmid) [Methylobacterium fujisawaense]|uniref:hypothetical protein n=1 Tax=Methylobacterium fujisawaense TaxID=107400 RepID=UPI0031F4D6AF